MTLAWGCIHEDEDIDLNTHRQTSSVERSVPHDPGSVEVMERVSRWIIGTLPCWPLSPLSPLSPLTSYTSSGAPAHCQDTPATLHSEKLAVELMCHTDRAADSCKPVLYLCHFLGGANNFILPKFNPFLPKFLPARGPCMLPSCSSKLFCQAVMPNCSANGQIGR